jgi:hypothetical protein
MNREPIAYSIRDAVAVSGLSRSRLYELANENKIDFRKADGRTLVIADSLRNYIASLPPKSTAA